MFKNERETDARKVRRARQVGGRMNGRPVGEIVEKLNRGRQRGTTKNPGNHVKFSLCYSSHRN